MTLLIDTAPGSIEAPIEPFTVVDAQVPFHSLVAEMQRAVRAGQRELWLAGASAPLQLARLQRVTRGLLLGVQVAADASPTEVTDLALGLLRAAAVNGGTLRIRSGGDAGRRLIAEIERWGYRTSQPLGSEVFAATLVQVRRIECELHADGGVDSHVIGLSSAA